MNAPAKTAATAAAYNVGYAAGRAEAVAVCFGGANTECPDFSTQDEYDAWASGYDDGFADVDDELS